MHYEIRRGFDDKRLTKRQRTSGTFMESPVVLGKIMHRGTPPRVITQEQFLQHKTQLLRMLLSGSIEIYVVDNSKKPARLDYTAARGIQLLEELNSPAGDSAPPQSPALSVDPKSEEEQEEQVLAPPSSADGGGEPSEPVVATPEVVAPTPVVVAQVPEKPVGDEQSKGRKKVAPKVDKEEP